MCTSRYTIDFRNGEALECERDAHAQNWHGEDIHWARAYGVMWHWSTPEADS